MQKIRIVAVGKLKESFWREAVAEYVKRLSRFAAVEIKELAERATIPKAITRSQALPVASWKMA